MAFYALKKRFYYQHWIDDMIYIFSRYYRREKYKEKYGHYPDIKNSLLTLALVKSILNKF